LKSQLLSGKIAVVTGASRGLGLGIVRAFVDEGAIVGMLSRDIESLKLHEATCRNAHGQAIAFQVDVTDKAEIHHAVDQLVNRFGPVDILVNNAGIAPSTMFVTTSDSERDRILDTNFKGTWNCAQCVAPMMIKQRSGKIINVSSVTGPYVSSKGMTAYSASKGAISGFTRALALELAEYGINVNAICPGSFDTKMMSELTNSRGTTPENCIRDRDLSIPLGRLGTIDEIGNLAVFLASHLSNYISGSEIVIDGANLIQEH
jgi:NAD(P)-dependent dehydrogenase (short-subunit alcohol dehydrogenase family)